MTEYLLCGRGGGGPSTEKYSWRWVKLYEISQDKTWPTPIILWTVSVNLSLKWGTGSQITR